MEIFLLQDIYLKNSHPNIWSGGKIMDWPSSVQGYINNFLNFL